MTAMISATRLNVSAPDDLTELDQWVLWRYAAVNGRKTKIPYQVNNRPADSTDPRTWTSFEEALRKWRNSCRKYAGLGFVFAKKDQLVGIDLDDALNGQGDLKDWARGTVGQFSDTYMEISPSRLGLKIWARGCIPANLPGVRVGDGQIEMYDHSRYFAVTGCAFHGAPLQVEDHAGDLVALYDRLTAGRKEWPLRPLPTGRIPQGQQHNTLVACPGHFGTTIRFLISV